MNRPKEKQKTIKRLKTIQKKLNQVDLKWCDDDYALDRIKEAQEQIDYAIVNLEHGRVGRDF